MKMSCDPVLSSHVKKNLSGAKGYDAMPAWQSSVLAFGCDTESPVPGRRVSALFDPLVGATASPTRTTPRYPTSEYVATAYDVTAKS